jgi:dipeptidyl aminopeptidase/acylaminoacyl peptidase
VRWLALLPALLLLTIGGSVARAGCTPTLEWEDAGPRWSPDGSSIAFYRVLPGCDPAPVAIEVIDEAGGAARLIGTTNGQWPPTWSPDGKELAFGGPLGIALASIEEGRTTGVTRGITRGMDTAPAWSPDGAWIAFRRGPPAGGPELWIVRPDGSGARRLAAGLHDRALPAWSPDSREIAFAGYSGGSVEVQIVDVATGRIRTVAPSPAFDATPSWSRDGSTIAFTSERDGEAAVYVVARDGSQVRRWLNGRDPVFAPTDALAYVRADGIWLEVGAVGPARLVGRSDVLGGVDWRPGGVSYELAFSAGGRCLRYGIYLVTGVAGRLERRATNPCEFHGRGLVRGTPFRDFLYGSSGPDRLFGLGGVDRLSAGAGNDLLDGDGGHDTLVGRGGDDLLIGRGDPDLIVGGPGRDRVFAGKGNDRIYARDRRRDTIDCGSGPDDSVVVDRIDVVAANCERVAEPSH